MYHTGAAEVDVMPTVPVHALSPVHSTDPLPPLKDNPQDPSNELSRSASFTYLSGMSKDAPAQPIKRTFSENVLSLQAGRGTKISDSMQTANKELFRRASRKARKKLSGSKFSLSPDDDEAEKDSTQTHGDNGDSSKSLSRSMTTSIRSLARKSWISTSRPSSPTRKEDKSADSKRNWSPTKRPVSMANQSITVPEPVASRSSSPSSHKDKDMEPGNAEPEITRFPRQEKASPQSRPFSGFAARNKSESSLKRLSRKSSASSLRSVSSVERLASSLPPSKVPPLPVSASMEKLPIPTTDPHKKKDPLWSAFRTIEGEYVQFQTKTGLQKAKVLRMTFLPFLAKYAQHPSNKSLRPEDLDRRVGILSKWWTTILEVLNNSSLSGTDRPAFLEAAVGIMMRSEWQIPRFASSSGETPRPLSITQTKSTNSLKSDESDFLTETIHQNVRNIFVQNLLAQMAFVVEKLSMRSAPASLVTFSGKVCAYAFFFCPGVADILVRLWRLPTVVLRRVFAEIGVAIGDELDLISKGIITSFPTPVRSLRVRSQATLSRHVQGRGSIPPGTEKVHWYGPWIGRWSGRDSDLFFVFTKYYHLLVSEFLPEGNTQKERACIPGFVPLHAQILIVFETTIYRQAGQHAVDNYASGSAGHMDNPDAAAPLPMTIANASRSIAENRLVMLLRDILADTDPDHSRLRELFASSFECVLKTATQKISLYNNDACFVLCDFMEEVLPIMSRYQQTHADSSFPDWSFWLRVCQQMMQSQTTLTQIRMIAFVYSMWSILISDEDRKRQLVLGWLLEPAFFYQHFCHWSPMVRHYFYRLLCWRVARQDNIPSILDIEILETISQRLNRCWAHYQYLSAEADMRAMCQPSSAPCSPAPSRCLIIIRTDSQPPPPSTLSSFEKFLTSGILSQGTPYDTHSSMLNTVPGADMPAVNNGKKKWNLFKGILPFNTLPGNNRPGEVTPPGSPEDVSTTTENSSGNRGSDKAISRPSTPPHQAFSFKFSLEFFESRPNLANKNRKLSPPVLPHNAQRVMDERRKSHDSSNQSFSDSSSKGSNSTKSTDIRPLKPRPHELASARYSGRALAEWGQVLMECRNFYARRMQEGVPKVSLVETPTLGVETFRMIG